MDMLQVADVEDARDRVIGLYPHLPLKTEKITLMKAVGRVLAQNVYADISIPSFDRSTVDGYAVRSADTAGAGESIPVFLRQIGKVEMGIPAGLTLKDGECAYIPTGGMLPENCDAVVMVEYCESFMQGQVAVSKACYSGENVVFSGSDIRRGDLLVSKGKQLRPQDVGALAAVGITFPEVFAPLRISIISTGDEVVAPEVHPMPGQVRDINTYALSSLALTHGFSVVKTSVVPDNAAVLLAAVGQAMKESDVVVVSGGSSRGEKDATQGVFRAASDPGVFLYGLAMKPGKPTILAFDKASSTLLVGLPGHPAAALMVFKRIIADAWFSFLGVGMPLGFSAVIESNIPGAPGRETCVPVRVFEGDKGALNAEAVFGESGLITTLTTSDGYVVIERNNEGLKKGESVSVRLF